MEEMLLTDEDLAKIFQVEPSTVRSWRNRKKIPQEVMFKVSGGKKSTVRYIKTKVDDWINGCL